MPSNSLSQYSRFLDFLDEFIEANRTHGYREAILYHIDSSWITHSYGHILIRLSLGSINIYSICCRSHILWSNAPCITYQLSNVESYEHPFSGDFQIFG